MPKNIYLVFLLYLYNGSNYDYHFIIKDLAEEFKKQITCLRKNTEKYITFTFPIEKKLQELIKIKKKLQKIYLTYHSFLIAQDL